MTTRLPRRLAFAKGDEEARKEEHRGESATGWAILQTRPARRSDLPIWLRCRRQVSGSQARLKAIGNRLVQKQVCVFDFYQPASGNY